MVQEIVRNMLVYVVMVTILKGLISDKGFWEIFRFVSGLILILLFISPMMSVLSLGGGWYQKLEENIFQIDKKQLEQEMKIADGNFEKILRKECKSQIEQQIRELALENGQTVREVETALETEEDGTWSVTQIHMTIENETQEVMSRSGQETSGKEEGSVEKIQKIVIGREQNQAVREEQDLLEDRDTRKLKKKICNKFQLKEKEVDVWKINGKNY